MFFMEFTIFDSEEEDVDDDDDDDDDEEEESHNIHLICPFALALFNAHLALPKNHHEYPID